MKPNMPTLAEYFSLEKEDVLHRVNYITIVWYQQNSTPLVEIAKLDKDYSIKHFDGADKKYSLICRNHKLGISKVLEKQVVEWYHNALIHPGDTHAELSIGQYFYWRSLRKTLYNVCSKWKDCQFIKRNKK